MKLLVAPCDNRGMRRAPAVTVVSAVAALALSFSFSLSLAACNTYRDQLLRSQQAFEQNQHERSLGLLRALEPDVTNLATPEQAQYAYLRGMTDYRMGHRSDARHWLSIAKAYDDGSPGLLPTDWKARMTEALDEMNGVVFSAGLAALAAAPVEAARKPSEDSAPRPSQPPAGK